MYGILVKRLTSVVVVNVVLRQHSDQTRVSRIIQVLSGAANEAVSERGPLH